MRNDSAAAVPVEFALLVECARAPRRTRAERVRRLAAVVGDWTALLDTAAHHRMLALLHAHLDAAASDLVPTDTMRALAAQTFANATANLALAAELVRVVDLLASRGIRSLPYKGPVLAQSVYGNLALRTMKDLDILLRPGDIATAIDVLAERGYEPAGSMHRLVVQLGLDYQAALMRPQDDMVLELHWTVMPRNFSSPFGLDDVWDSRVETTLAGRRIAAPSHEDMLAILCIHGCKHRWKRLEWVCGVAELLRTKPLGWSRIFDQAERWHAGRMLRVGLLLAHELLQAPVPGTVLDVARNDADAVALVPEVIRAMLATTPASAEHRLDAFQLRLQERVVDRIRFLWFRHGATFIRRSMSAVGRLLPAADG